MVTPLQSHCSDVCKEATMIERVTYDSILAARDRIRGVVHRTPVLTCKEANRISGKQLFFKSEHLQCTGSFKARGALNSVKKLMESSKNVTGVVTHSSGNHGQALAWAASVAGLPCTVVVPQGSPAGKVAAIRGYGAELVECYPSPAGREEAAQKVVTETGKIFISPYDHPSVIAGQGTLAIELLEEIPDLDAIFCAVSGGGLSSGIAIAAKAIKPDIKIYLVTPKGKMLENCLRAGERLWPNPPKFLNTIAEAIRMQQLGFNTFEILKDSAEPDVFEVSDDQMIAGMKFSFHRMKQVIEAAAGATIAAVFSDKMATLPADVQKIGVILCGGNVDIERLPW